MNPVLIFLCLQLLLLSLPIRAEILQCSNHHGRLIFTDQVHLCAHSIQEKSLSSNNLMSSQHVDIDVNYRIQRRDYSRYDNSSWLIYYEASMYEGDPVLLKRSLEKLSRYLLEVELLLPASSINLLKKVDFYLLWGKASPQGGKSSGLRYLRNNERVYRKNIDPSWNESVVIFSANNFMSINPQLTRHVLIHELAHAWHIQERWLYNKEIKAAANHAEKHKLYHLLKGENGQYIPKAYAMKNYFEYFAELSSIYFARNYYFPFDREQLKTHDSQGYALVKKLWGLE